MLVFYVFDSLLEAISGQNPAVASSPIWKYTWLAYLVTGIVIPTYMGMLLKFLRKKFERTFAARFPGILNACDRLAEYKLQLF